VLCKCVICLGRLVAYPLIGRGAEWRLHREWYERSALSDLLGALLDIGTLWRMTLCPIQAGGVSTI
jgi:hypothetical protein